MYSEPNPEEVAAFYGALLEGEEVEPQSLDCHVSVPFLRFPIFGRLFLSNFKLFFKPSENTDGYTLLAVRSGLLSFWNFRFPSLLMAFLWI
jgi:hypothetical protein